MIQNGKHKTLVNWSNKHDNILYNLATASPVLPAIARVAVTDATTDPETTIDDLDYSGGSYGSHEENVVVLTNVVVVDNSQNVDASGCEDCEDDYSTSTENGSTIAAWTQYLLTVQPTSKYIENWNKHVMNCENIHLSQALI